MRIVLRLILCVFALGAGLRAVPAVADSYAVGINDELSLRVQQWMPITGEIQEWEALAGAYVVGADGTITVPFLGSVEAEGRTRTQIATEIGEALKERFALSTAPDAAVEITRYRPIYVSGLVRNGGEYPFSPGLTVRQAVSLAGGLSDELRRTSLLAREMIQAEGSLRIYEGQYLRLVVKKARLDAELEERDEIGPIPGLEQTSTLDAIILDESLILTARRERVAREMEGFDNQKALLEREIEALGQKQDTLQRQLELTRENVENATALAERGLAASNRVLDSERSLANVESQLLDISTAILRARQGIAEAEMNRASVQDTFRSDLTVERQRVETELEEVAHRIEIQRLLALDAASLVEPAYGQVPGIIPDPSYTVMRMVDGVLEELPVDGGVPLQPGDVVDVGVSPLAVQ